MFSEDVRSAVTELFDEAQERGSSPRLLTAEQVRAADLRGDTPLVRELYVQVYQHQTIKERAYRSTIREDNLPPPVQNEQRACATCGGTVEVRPGVPNLVHLGPPRSGCATKRAR